MKSGRQALQLFLNASVIVIIVIQVFDQIFFEVLHGLEFLQIEQLALEQADEVLHDRIVQPASPSGSYFAFQHLLVLFVLAVPALVGVKE